MNSAMNRITKKLIEMVTNYRNGFDGAFSIRQNGLCIGIQSSDNVEIIPKTNRPGIDVYIKDGTKDETVYVPTCVTQGGIQDVVFNDYHIGENCDVKIISGCGVNTDDGREAKHSGVHTFNIGKFSRVSYTENHIGTGEGDGTRSINPSTNITLEEGSQLEIDATQISGIDIANRSTRAKIGKNASLVIHERLFTEKNQNVKTNFIVELNGENSSTDIVSRSVARDHSYQSTDSTIIGNAPCNGHSECDAIIGEEAIVNASPRLFAHHKDAAMIHEAAIGKIAGEQILKLRTLGLTEEEAENQIINGFLS